MSSKGSFFNHVDQFFPLLTTYLSLDNWHSCRNSFIVIRENLRIFDIASTTSDLPRLVNVVKERPLRLYSVSFLRLLFRLFISHQKSLQSFFTDVVLFFSYKSLETWKRQKNGHEKIPLQYQTDFREEKIWENESWFRVPTVLFIKQTITGFFWIFPFWFWHNFYWPKVEGKRLLLMFRSSHIFVLWFFGILVTLVAWFSFRFFRSCPSCKI